MAQRHLGEPLSFLRVGERRRQCIIRDFEKGRRAACRRMVEEDLRDLLKPGMSAADLFTAYQVLGDDPFVVPVDGAAGVEFSVWDYAKERCLALCG